MSDQQGRSTVRSAAMAKVLQTLEVLGGNLSDYRYLVVPSLVR